MHKIRVAYLGSPIEVVPPLKRLLEMSSDGQVKLVGVVTQPARPSGRNQTLADPPLATFAKANGLNLLQPENASAPEFISEFRNWKPDIAITAAYGQILTREFLSIPSRATINIHPSLLPHYRGATPVPAALLDGRSETGVTILFTVSKLDAGNIIVQKKFPVAPAQMAGDLTKFLFEQSAELLPGVLQKLKDVQFAGMPQDESQVTFCRKIHKADGAINWNRNAEEINNRFRAFYPWPGSFSFCQGRRISLLDMKLSEARSLKPGEAVFDKNLKSLIVGTGDGTVEVQHLKPAGGNAIDAVSFWNGLKVKDAVRFVNNENE